MLTHSDLRVSVEGRSITYRAPHRVIFGRRHAKAGSRAIGESFQPLGDDLAMSREWFSVEQVMISSDGSGDGIGEPALQVRCLSRTNSVQVWDGSDPVRVRTGGRYVAQRVSVFAGDLFTGRIIGAHLELSGAGSAQESLLERSASRSHATTPRPLEASPLGRNVAVARYQGYYRFPPQFDPRPVPWGEVAAQLRLKQKVAEDAMAAVKRHVEQLYPGWLPQGSETQKSFHDHLRTVLEMHGVLSPEALAAFDLTYA